MPSKPSKLTPSFVVPYQDHLFDLRKKNCWWRIWIDPYRLHQTSSYIITDHRTANMDRIEQIEPQDHQAADMPLSLFQLDSMGIRVTRQQAARNLQNMLLKAFLSNFGHSPKASASMTQDDTRWYFYEHRPSSLRKTWKNTFKFANRSPKRMLCGHTVGSGNSQGEGRRPHTNRHAVANGCHV